MNVADITGLERRKVPRIHLQPASAECGCEMAKRYPRFGRAATGASAAARGFVPVHLNLAGLCLCVLGIVIRGLALPVGDSTLCGRGGTTE